MPYPCPWVGTEQETKNCKRPAQTMQGFKHHLTRQHGGWTAEQIAAVVGDAIPEGDEVPRAAEIESESETQTPEGERERTHVSEAAKVERKSRKAAIRLSNALGGVKDYIAALLPQVTMLFMHEKMGIEGTLSEDGAKILGEAWGAYFDLLGVDLENADPVKIKIGGRKLMFIYPLLMLPLTLAVMTGVKINPPKAKEEAKPKEETANALE